VVSQSEMAQLATVLAQATLQQRPVPSTPQILESQLPFELQGAPAASPVPPPLVETDEPEAVARPPEELPVLEAAAEVVEVEVETEPVLEPLLGDGRVTVWVQPSTSEVIAIEVTNSCFMPSLCSVACISHLRREWALL
jgi:hypothetical protein